MLSEIYGIQTFGVCMHGYKTMLKLCKRDFFYIAYRKTPSEYFDDGPDKKRGKWKSMVKKKNRNKNQQTLP